MDTDSFVYEIETEGFYRDIAKDVEAKFDTSGYLKDDNQPLTIGKNKNVIGMMKDGLAGKIMTEFVALRTKMNAYRKIDNKVEDKRCKGTKKYVALLLLLLLLLLINVEINIIAIIQKIAN